jgi:hypothetical protein
MSDLNYLVEARSNLLRHNKNTAMLRFKAFHNTPLMKAA